MMQDNKDECKIHYFNALKVALDIIDNTDGSSILYNIIFEEMKIIYNYLMEDEGGGSNDTIRGSIKK